MMTPEQLQAVTDAARKVVDTWKACPNTVASMTMDCHMRALSTALDGPGAVTEPVLFHADETPNAYPEEYTYIHPQGCFAWTRNGWRKIATHGVGEYQKRFPRERRLTPTEAAEFFATHGTPPTGGTK